jgi:N-acetylneuraminate synthase
MVGPGRQPFIIAEMSGNHNQSLERALHIVDAVAEAGAHAIKLQTYTADTMTLDIAAGDFMVAEANSLWRGKSLYQLYQEAFTPWEWHAPIMERARSHGLLAFSSPFDLTAVEFLENLEVPCYKIASFEIGDLRLIRRAAATRKPLIISTGMATDTEVRDAVGAARGAGCSELLLLKCTSSYPADASESNLLTIPDLRSAHGCLVGLSDHTLGIGAAVASVALGAVAIEKHVTLRRAEGGVDAGFSLEPGELKALVAETDSAWRALGRVHYGPTASEEGSLRFRRSLYVVKDVAKGDAFTEQNVRAIRPGFGLAPKHLDRILGRRARLDIARGTALRDDLVE